MNIAVTSLQLAEGNHHYTVQFRFNNNRKIIVEFQGSILMNQEEAIVEQALGVMVEALQTQKKQ